MCEGIFAGSKIGEGEVSISTIGGLRIIIDRKSYFN
jgi:hypothetical protein